MEPINCVPTEGEWSLEGGFDGSPDGTERLMKLYDNLKPILIEEMAQYKLQTVVESYMAES